MGLGLVVAMFTVWKFGQAYSVFETAATFVLSTAITTVLGLLLVRADTVRHRVHAGQPVGVLSRLFFGAGIRSLFAWLIVLLIVGFPLAIWLGTMTSSMPAG